MNGGLRSDRFARLGGLSVRGASRRRRQPVRREANMAYQLYAWAAPIQGAGFADHTWVTGYDNRTTDHPGIGDVVAAGDDYWFCWGIYRPRGGTPRIPDGHLASRAADRRLARCLVRENEGCRSSLPARGTIFRYSVDGVCHQLANQVLFAAGAPELTVEGARGYSWSEFLYGTYGLRPIAWAAQVERCRTPAPARPPRTEETRVPLPDDKFERRAAEILGGEDPLLLERLLALRGRIREETLRGLALGAPEADFANSRNEMFKAAAARLLGEERFIRLFGFPPGEEMKLVDPEMMTEDEAGFAVGPLHPRAGLRGYRVLRGKEEEEEKRGEPEPY